MSRIIRCLVVILKLQRRKKKKKKKNSVSVEGIITQIIEGDGFEMSVLDGAFIIQQG